MMNVEFRHGRYDEVRVKTMRENMRKVTLQLQPISSEGAFAATAVTARVPGVTNTQIGRADALPMLAVTLMRRKHFWR